MGWLFMRLRSSRLGWEGVRTRLRRSQMALQLMLLPLLQIHQIVHSIVNAVSGYCLLS
jgi:hypothetical protein